MRLGLPVGPWADAGALPGLIGRQERSAGRLGVIEQERVGRLPCRGARAGVRHLALFPSAGLPLLAEQFYERRDVPVVASGRRGQVPDAAVQVLDGFGDPAGDRLASAGQVEH